MYTRIRLLLLIQHFISSFSFSNFQTLKFLVTLLSGTVRPRRLKLGIHVDSGRRLELGTHMDSGQMCRIYQNQAAAAYCSLYFLFFLFPIFKY